MLRWVVLSGALILLVLPPTMPAQPPRGATADADARRAEVLRWLDSFLGTEVLFRREDLMQLRARIEAMPPDALDQWLGETERLRQTLDSPAWRETRQWLRDFLRVQAIYSDEEIEELRDRAASSSPDEILEMLETIAQKRWTLNRARRSASSARDASLKVNESLIQQQQEAARRAAARARNNSRPATPGGPPVPQARRYSPPPPLINSKQLARDAVNYSIFGPWGW